MCCFKACVDRVTLDIPETNRKMKELREKIISDLGWGRRFLKSDPSIIKEYAGGVPLVIIPAYEELSSDREIDTELIVDGHWTVYRKRDFLDELGI